jgi:hypothetical protein
MESVGNKVTNNSLSSAVIGTQDQHTAVYNSMFGDEVTKGADSEISRGLAGENVDAEFGPTNRHSYGGGSSSSPESDVDGNKKHQRSRSFEFSGNVESTSNKWVDEIEEFVAQNKENEFQRPSERSVNERAASMLRYGSGVGGGGANGGNIDANFYNSVRSSDMFEATRSLEYELRQLDSTFGSGATNGQSSHAVTVSLKREREGDSSICAWYTA